LFFAEGGSAISLGFLFVFNTSYDMEIEEKKNGDKSVLTLQTGKACK
jgi:hypothetical protein